MKIISLAAENFKRLTAVEVTPTGNIVEISGGNGEGKTSTLDAIWAALGGKDACPPKPIHTGADKAEIRVILGEDGVAKFKVTRRFGMREGVPYTTDLKLEGAEGGRFEKAQEMLNTLVGQFAFEPMAILDMKDADQITLLRRFVPDVDFDAMARLNKKDYEERTEVGRTVRDLKGQLAGLPPLPETIPTEVDVLGLEAQLANASEHNTTLERRQAKRDAAVDRITAIEAQIKTLTEERDALQTSLEEAEELPAPIDVVKVQEKLAEGRHANALLAEVKSRTATQERLTAAEAKVEALTKAIDMRKDDAAKAVLAAKMPVEGLGFGEDAKGDGFVTLNGEPLSQASMAQKIRTAVAIAAAMNPKLRVARIADGSLLDKKSWAALAEYAEAHDLQIWVETVDAKGLAAIVIENGSVATPEVGDVI
jgi:DNA repair exonuclease SbcCD ATPase subunit